MDREVIEAIYQRRFKAGGSAMSPHMPTLRALAEECETAVEFGVRRCMSTIALLAGGVSLWSFDIDWPERYEWIRGKIERAAGGKWHPMRVSSIAPVAVLPLDLLLHDSLHNYDHVKAELDLHADSISRFLVFHDTVSHGKHGQSDSCGEPDPDIRGIMPAIKELMERDPTWHVKAHYKNSAGLMVLERRTVSSEVCAWEGCSNPATRSMPFKGETVRICGGH